MKPTLGANLSFSSDSIVNIHMLRVYGSDDRSEVPVDLSGIANALLKLFTAVLQREKSHRVVLVNSENRVITETNDNKIAMHI